MVNGLIRFQKLSDKKLFDPVSCGRTNLTCRRSALITGWKRRFAKFFTIMEKGPTRAFSIMDSRFGYQRFFLKPPVSYDLCVGLRISVTVFRRPLSQIVPISLRTVKTSRTFVSRALLRPAVTGSCLRPMGTCHRLICWTSFTTSC